MSTDFPLLNSEQGWYGGGPRDGFIVRLDFDPPASSCGDFDASGEINIADIVYLINYIFGSGGAPLDLRKGDIDCDNFTSIADAVYMIQYIFADGPAPCAACQ